MNLTSEFLTIRQENLGREISFILAGENKVVDGDEDSSMLVRNFQHEYAEWPS